MLMPAAIPAVAITATPAETWPVKVVHALEEMKELLSNCKTCDLNKYGSCGAMVSIFMSQLFNLGLTFKSKYRRDPNSKNTCFSFTSCNLSPELLFMKYLQLWMTATNGTRSIGRSCIMAPISLTQDGR